MWLCLHRGTQLRNSASSFHWLSSSIFTVCSFVRSSRIRDTSSHLHYMMFQTIQTIYFLWGYDPGNMSVSFIAELSPVYCCLVSICKGKVEKYHLHLTFEVTLHNVQIVQYLFLATQQAGTYLQSSQVWHHLTYIHPSELGCEENREKSIFVSFKL